MPTTNGSAPRLISAMRAQSPQNIGLSSSSINELETLGLRRLRPETVGPAHRGRPLRAGLPGIVDVVARPDHQRGNLGGVGMRNEGMATDKTGSLALRQAIAIQELSGLVNPIGLGPVMRQDANHATSAPRQTPMEVPCISAIINQAL